MLNTSALLQSLPDRNRILHLQPLLLHLFDCIGAIKSLRNLLQCSSACLNEEEVDAHELDEQPALEEEVELPGPGVDADGDEVLGEEKADVGCDVLEEKTIGADVERKDFEGVGDVEGDPVECQ